MAVRCGRASNAEVLLNKAKEKAELNDMENQLEHEKYGLASINLMNAFHQYPLHVAVLHDHLVKSYSTQVCHILVFRIVFDYFLTMVHKSMHLQGFQLKN